MRPGVGTPSLLGAMALSTSAIALSSAAHAQDSGEAAGDIDTVFVTATRREESVQEVPIAVSVIGEQAIEQIKPRDLKDFTGLAPNVHIGQAGATPGGGAIFIRGLGYQDVEKTQNPPVGVSVDGIFLGTNTGQIIDAFDIEQIEISRGPQGIFFGKNTTGGVINVTRTSPTREFGLRGSAAYGSHDEYILKTVGNVPLGENGGLKLGGTYHEFGGYQENLFTGEDVNGFEYWAINAALDYDLTEWINLSLIFDHFDLDGGGTPVQFGNAFTAQILGLDAIPGYNPETGSPAGLEPRQILSDFEDKSGLTTDIINATLTIDTPVGELVSVTGYLDSEDFQNQDFDGTCTASPGCPSLISNPLAPLLHTQRPQTYQQFTQELRLAGTLDRLDYLAGFYYYDHEVRLDQVTNDVVFQSSGENNDSWSLFGNLDFRVLDNVTLSAGVRYIDESKDFFTGYTLGAPDGLVLIPQITDDAEFSDTITRFAVDWQATDDTLLYASRSEGFRSGGISIRSTLSEQVEGQPNCLPDDGDAIPNEILCPDNAFLTYDPESNAAWEIGAKNTLLDGQLTLNGAFFRTKVDGLQSVQIVVTPGYGPGTNTYINNLPEAVVKGAELEFVLRPEALEGFTLSGVFGLQDGEVTDGVVDGTRAQIGVGGTAGAAGTFADFTGTTEGLGRIADYNYNIRGAYEFPVGEGVVTTSLGYNYIDDHALSQGFGGQDIEPGYGLLSAYLGYDWNDRFGISVTGRNLTDKDYRINTLAAVAFQRYADDLNWLVEIKGRY